MIIVVIGMYEDFSSLGKLENVTKTQLNCDYDYVIASSMPRDIVTATVRVRHQSLSCPDEDLSPRASCSTPSVSNC